MGMEFQFYKMESSRDLLHNKVNILNTTEQYTLKQVRWQVLCYVFFNHNLKFFKSLKMNTNTRVGWAPNPI